MFFQKEAICIDGIKPELFRQTATFGKRQNVADGSAMGVVCMGWRIRHIQGAKPAALAGS
jgi:hypothetical protein